MHINVPVGYSDFAALRRDNCQYVDKTGFLEELLSPRPAMATLFTRPRRFGKTLFLSMLAEFFDITKDSRELFAGLKISENEALCKEWMNQYPVVFLSLKGIDGEDFAEAQESVKELVMDVCSNYKELRTSPKVREEDRIRLVAISNMSAKDSQYRNSLKILTRALADYYGKPVIVLIDEYDVPVVNAWNNGYYKRMRSFMGGFLDALKDNRSLKFGILTGCLRITWESLFAGLNHLLWYGVGDEQYADMFGFTEAEVDTLLDRAGLSSRKEEIREWYGGYCFGRRRDICNPWSVLNHVAAVQADPEALPEAWWVNTGASGQAGDFAVGRLFGKYAGHGSGPDGVPWWQREEVRDWMTLLWAGRSMPAFLNETSGYASLLNSVDNFWGLLYMTGYLTKAHPVAGSILPPPAVTMLAIPNREVREAFRREIASRFEQALPADVRRQLYEAFWRAEEVQCEEMLSRAMLQGMSQHDTQDKGSWQAERACHCLVLGLFALFGCDVRSNLEERHGRHAIEVFDRPNSRAAILEIRKAGTAEELDRAAEAGLVRIEAQGHDLSLRKEGYRTILHWSLAFCEKQCRARVRPVDNWPGSGPGRQAGLLGPDLRMGSEPAG